MHKLRWVLLALLALTVPVTAQGEQWSMMVYNGNTGELVRVYQDGTQQAYRLSLPENAYLSSQDMAFSADGNRVAYCAISYPPGDGNQPVQPNARLFVRDLAGGMTLLERDFGSAIGCTTGRDAFNNDETQVVVALANYYPQDSNADFTKPAWQIFVLDMATGSTILELNANSQPALDVGLMMEGAMLPLLRQFENNEVVFGAVPYGIGGVAQFVAYRWDLGSGTVTVEVEGVFSHTGGDRLAATGEAVWTGMNPTLPAAEPAGPMGYGNVVMAAVGDGAPNMVYFSPDWTLIAAKFINDGSQIAVLHFPAYDPNQEIGAQPTKWVAVDRSGNAVDLQTGIVEYSDITAAPGGYAFLRTSYPDPANVEQVRYALEYYQGDQMIELWSAETPAWEIAWSAATPVAQGLPPFTPINP